MAVIRDLKTDFTGVGQVRGFKFTQIRKTKSAFLYLIDTGDRIYYEVFRKRLNRRFACISYPTDKAFGIWAWTTPDITVAFEILNDLSRKEQNKNTLYNNTNKSIKN